MGRCCSKLFVLTKQGRNANALSGDTQDLPEDPPLPAYPVQRTDAEVSQEHNGLAEDFVDLHQDVFPVECSEPSQPIIPRCTNTMAVCLGILLRQI